MKGYRFYAEMPQDRKSKSASKANPFFPWTVAALRERATRIPEDLARILSPELFRYLES